MNRRITTLVVVLSTMLFQFSCEKVTSVVDQNFQKSYLIPTAVNNSWIYTDSNQTHFDTVSVTGVYNNQDYTWWKLRNSSFTMSQCGGEFGVRNDSIFSRQATETGSIVIGLVFIPPRDITIVFPSLVGGDALIEISVTQYDSTYTVPAGSFDRYVTYIFDGGLEKDSLVIVPGVGVVARILEGRAYPGRPAFTVKSYLKSYCVTH